MGSTSSSDFWFLLLQCLSYYYIPLAFCWYQGNHQNFVPSLVSHKLWLIWIGMKQKKKIDKKNSKWPTQKKLSFSTTAKSWAIVTKILQIGPWVRRIDWCEGHWCGSTYMAVRLSDISSKTGKKCIFGVFRPILSLCQTASQPYRLSHTNALRINQFY